MGVQRAFSVVVVMLQKFAESCLLHLVSVQHSSLHRAMISFVRVKFNLQAGFKLRRCVLSWSVFVSPIVHLPLNCVSLCQNRHQD
jgi:hypothetical protein